MYFNDFNHKFTTSDVTKKSIEQTKWKVCLPNFFSKISCWKRNIQVELREWKTALLFQSLRELQQRSLFGMKRNMRLFYWKVLWGHKRDDKFTFKKKFTGHKWKRKKYGELTKDETPKGNDHNGMKLRFLIAVPAFFRAGEQSHRSRWNSMRWGVVSPNLTSFNAISSSPSVLTSTPSMNRKLRSLFCTLSTNFHYTFSSPKHLWK